MANQPIFGRDANGTFITSPKGVKYYVNPDGSLQVRGRGMRGFKDPVEAQQLMNKFGIGNNVSTEGTPISQSPSARLAGQLQASQIPQGQLVQAGAPPAINARGSAVPQVQGEVPRTIFGYDATIGNIGAPGGVYMVNRSSPLRQTFVGESVGTPAAAGGTDYSLRYPTAPVQNLANRYGWTLDEIYGGGGPTNTQYGLPAPARVLPQGEGALALPAERALLPGTSPNTANPYANQVLELNPGTSMATAQSRALATGMTLGPTAGPGIPMAANTGAAARNLVPGGYNSIAGNPGPQLLNDVGGAALNVVTAPKLGGDPAAPFRTAAGAGGAGAGGAGGGGGGAAGGLGDAAAAAGGAAEEAGAVAKAGGLLSRGKAFLAANPYMAAAGIAPFILGRLPAEGAAGDVRQIGSDIATGALIGGTAASFIPIPGLSTALGAGIGALGGGAYGLADTLFNLGGGPSDDDIRNSISDAAKQAGLNPGTYTTTFNLYKKLGLGGSSQQIAQSIGQQLLSDAATQRATDQANINQGISDAANAKYALALQKQAQEFYAPYQQNIISSGLAESQLLGQLANQVPPEFKGVFQNQAQQALSQSNRLADAYAFQSAASPAEMLSGLGLQDQQALAKLQYQQSVINAQQGQGGGSSINDLVNQLSGSGGQGNTGFNP